MGHSTNSSGRSHHLDADSAVAIAETLQALASPSRLLILSHLRQGSATVGELSTDLQIEQSAVSHQLRLLRLLGLVVRARQGRSVSYALYDDHVAALLDEAVYHAEHVRMGITDSTAAEALANDSRLSQPLR